MEQRDEQRQTGKDILEELEFDVHARTHQDEFQDTTGSICIPSILLECVYKKMLGSFIEVCYLVK